MKVYVNRQHCNQPGRAFTGDHEGDPDKMEISRELAVIWSTNTQLNSNGYYMRLAGRNALRCFEEEEQ